MSDAPAGWYPNPEPGPRYRYWDGQEWTSKARNQVPTETESPSVAHPPGPGAPRASDRVDLPHVQPHPEPAGSHIADPGVTRDPAMAPDPMTPDPMTPDPMTPDPMTSDQTLPAVMARSSMHPAPGPVDAGDWDTSGPSTKRGPVLAVVAFASVLTLLLVMLGLYLTKGKPGPSAAASPSSSVRVANQACWGISSATPSAAASPPKRVAAGGISFPRLGAPWSKVIYGTSYGATTDSAHQEFVAKKLSGNHTWVGNAVVAAITMERPDYTAQEAAAITSKCLRINLYGHRDEGIPTPEKVTRSAAMTINGHAAWVHESTLSVNIPQRQFATAEQFTLVVARIANGKYAMYYASVPASNTTQAAQARALVKKLLIG